MSTIWWLEFITVFRAQYGHSEDISIHNCASNKHIELYLRIIHLSLSTFYLRPVRSFFTKTQTPLHPFIMKFSIVATSALLATVQAAALPVEPGTPAFPAGLNPGESCTTTSTKGVLGCDDGTGGTFNIVNGQREKRQTLDDLAISADEAVKNFNNIEPGTPVVDGKLNLRAGESCSTTSTKGVLGCDDGTGGTFNIVNGKRQKRQIQTVTVAQAEADFQNLEPGTRISDPSLPLKDGESCTTTSTKGVLACSDVTGATFNIVNGERKFTV
ncbi:unnamed protein product [Periconia digitata]|uniref:Uncharacterized protein n=1 Tax=Periconia digitata TaxID=1303443 RepID=A0A9W4UUY3_9PLEO|nr:unnamed protein product [Periconia digitata]